MAAPEPSAFFVGDVALDEYFAADRWPGVADKAYVRTMRSHVGGMIANAACVYAGLGGRPEFISLLNDGPVSRRLCAALGDLGVSTAHMLRDGSIGDPGNLIFLVDGEHVVLTVDIDRSPMVLRDDTLAALLAPGFLYTTLNRAKRLRFERLAGAELLAELRGRDRRLVFDLDVEGFEAEDLPYLRDATALIMNRTGFDRSFGRAGLAEMNGWMRGHGVGLVVRTLAAEGVEAFDGTMVLRLPGYRVPVIDVTGAGDTFGGTLLFGLAHGMELGASLELGLAAAARAVTVEGPQGGVATLGVVRAFQAEHGHRRP
jgi:sugar/nucleoside kinase (ribokinase family)